jgi:hypothetical protein
MMRALVDNPPPASAPAAPSSLPPEPLREPDRGVSAARIGTVVGLGVVALTGLGLGIGFGAAAQTRANSIATGEGCVPTIPMSVARQRVNYDVSLERQQEWTVERVESLTTPTARTLLLIVMKDGGLGATHVLGYSRFANRASDRRHPTVRR